MGKYGTDLTGFAAFEGGVNNDKGAPLVATNSDGATALLLGPVALREIQAGVANGDFSIPPDDAISDITDENPLPYWTAVTNTGITLSVIDSTSRFSGNGSGSSLMFTIAPSTPLDRSAYVYRYVPISSSYNRAHSYYPEVMIASGTSSSIGMSISIDWYDNAFTFISSGGTRTTTTTSTGLLTPLSPSVSQSAPSNAAYALFKISVSVNAAGGSGLLTQVIVISEARLSRGDSTLLVSEQTSPGTYAPALIQQISGVLTITPATSSAFTGSITTTGSIGLAGSTYGSTALTGPSFQLAGTTGAAWVFSNASGAADVLATNSTTRAGVLVTKSTAGQPSIVVNGTGTTDAFADALRNGGLASDNTNGRFYVYNGSAWKYAALTTPSDSRLKEEITSISGALDTLRQLVPVAFRWKRPEAHPRTDAVADDGKRLGFIADQVATTDLKHWVEDMGVGEIEHDLVEDTDGRVLAVNIPQNEMEALVVQALLDIDTRLKALESR